LLPPFEVLVPETDDDATEAVWGAVTGTLLQSLLRNRFMNYAML
jgi:hypothetical protein